MALLFDTLLISTLLLGTAILFATFRPQSAAASKSNVLIAAVLTVPFLPLILQLPIFELPVLAYGAESKRPLLRQLSARTLGETQLPSNYFITVLLLVYCSGASLALARLINSFRLLNGLRQTAITVEHLELEDYSAEDLGEVRIYAVDGLASPLAFGLWRKHVILPSYLLAEPSSSIQLAAVLRHELAHIRRSDPLLQFVMSLVLIALWWHPLARPVRRSMRLHAELATDDQVLLDGMNCADYAEVMLDFARAQRSTTAPGVMPMAFWAPGRTQWLRISSVLGSRHRVRTSRSKIVELFSLNVAFVLLLSSLQLSAALEPPMIESLANRQVVSQQEAANEATGESYDYLR